MSKYKGSLKIHSILYSFILPRRRKCSAIVSWRTVNTGGWCQGVGDQSGDGGVGGVAVMIVPGVPVPRVCLRVAGVAGAGHLAPAVTPASAGAIVTIVTRIHRVPDMLHGQSPAPASVVRLPHSSLH